ncbi:DUF177 domain-containing protein [Paenibacillus sp. tmac-D7]|uniref:YceD family protein n=1 Tax=Paenibacillus sp. tmac-D7 TaxID=2591462 RepID=UPI00114292A8|nr:DUF177 domain-containing protein [Paenibacillus sp. tmac-D7]
MFIQLKELATKGSIRLEGQEDLTDNLPKTGSLLGYGPLQVRLEARDVEGAAEVDGELEIDVEQSCSRCLAPVAQHVTVPFHETFVKGEEKAIDEESDEDEEDDDDDVLYVTGDRIELKPYLAEAVMLSLPFIPLCKEDCKGLCPVCGTDRNERECGCKQEKVDPRLAGLADFFKNE